jgi:hypothetical protein
MHRLHSRVHLLALSPRFQNTVSFPAALYHLYFSRDTLQSTGNITQCEERLKEQERTNEGYATLLRDLRAATSSTQTAANCFSAAIAETAHELGESRRTLIARAQSPGEVSRAGIVPEDLKLISAPHTLRKCPRKQS